MLNCFAVPSSANFEPFMPSEQDWEDYFREQWDYESGVYLSEELQKTIKNHPGFTDPPIGPIGDYIVSEELLGVIPQSFATSYLLHNGEDVSLLCKIIDPTGETQPTVMVYPKCEAIHAVDEKLTIGGHVSLATLQLENPTIANLVIDNFGTTTGPISIIMYPQLNLHICVCVGQNQHKASLSDENG